MLLDIEARIGELLPTSSEAQATMKGQPAFDSKDRAGATWKKIGISRKRATQARHIAKHPEIIEKVKAQARENEDIPTRTVPGHVISPFYASTDAQKMSHKGLSCR